MAIGAIPVKCTPVCLDLRPTTDANVDQCRKCGTLHPVLSEGNPDRTVPAVAEFEHNPATFETYTQEIRNEPFRTIMPPREAEEARVAEGQSNQL